MDAALDGDPAAFGELVRLYQDWVHRLAYRMVYDAHEAADMSQEVFLRLYRGLDRYDRDRPFGPWFFRLASNVCLNALKKRKAAPFTFQALERHGADFDPPAATAEAAEDAGRRDLARLVRDGVRTLPPDYRLALSLHYLEGMSYEDMAAILELPLGTVKNRLFRAREKLKNRLPPLGAELPGGAREVKR